MARLVSGSTRDLCYTVAEMYMQYLRNMLLANFRRVQVHIEHQQSFGIDQSSRLYQEWANIERVTDILNGPRWVDLTHKFAFRMEVWMLGYEDILNCRALLSNTKCEQWAKSLIRLAIMSPLQDYTRKQWEDFLNAGHVKKVALLGAYLEAHTPPPMIEGPPPMTFMELADRYKEVYRNSYEAALPVGEAIKEIAPGGLFD